MIREPLDYDAFFAHRTVTRLRQTGYGTSAIEKVTEGPHLADAYLYDNAAREFAAYTSGMLSDLGPIRAPRLLDAREEPDGRLILVIEEIRHEGGRPLGERALLRAAHDLGGMARRFLGRVPDAPWLFTDWITRHSQPGAWAEGAEVLARAGSPALRLLEAQDDLRAILEAAPVTLCHHDAVGANVFLSPEGTVLIDWESVGPGPVGADLASLLLSPRRGDASAHVVKRILPEAVRAYCDGFGGGFGGGSGGGGPMTEAQVREVQRVVDAAIGLRWKLARDVAATVAAGEPARRGSLPDEAPAAALDELETLTDVLLEAGRRIVG